MTYRGGPRTIDERVADIEEQLRKTTSVAVATSPGVDDHDDLDNLGANSHPHYQLRAEQGEPDGYPSLDDDGVVPDEQLPTDLVRTADLPDVEAAAAAAAQAVLADVELLTWLRMVEA